MEGNEVEVNMVLLDAYFKRKISNEVKYFFYGYAFKNCVKDFANENVTNEEKECFKKIMEIGRTLNI